MADPFIDQLAQLAREQTLDNKWVLVPDHQVGWTLGERMVLEGHDWFNLRFVTPLQLALEAAGPPLLARGKLACPRELDSTLLLSALMRWPAHHPFTELMDQPGVLEQLWWRLMRCRMEAVRWQPFDEWYEFELQRIGWADAPQVLQEAQGRRTRVESRDWVAVYPYTHWPARTLDFIQSLPGKRLPAPSPAVFRPASLKFFVAPSRQVELRHALQCIDRPLDQVELVVDKEDIPVLADLLVELNCPASFGEGLPIRLSRACQAVSGLLQWVEDDFPADQMRALLMGNYLKAPPNSWVAARLIHQAGIRWGMSAYTRSLKSLGDEGMQLASWFRRVFAGVTDGQMGASTLSWLLEEHLDGEPEAKATLEPIIKLGNRGLTERLQRTRWFASQPRPGKLHVCGQEQMGLSGRPFILVTGQHQRGCETDWQEDWALPPELAFVLQPSELRCQLESELVLSYVGGNGQPPNQWYSSLREESGQSVQSIAVGWPGPLAYEQVWRDFPHLAQGQVAQRARHGDHFSPFDGVVPSATTHFEPKGPWSVHRLTILERCPFKFFLREGLKIYEPMKTACDYDQWLDELTRGQILHELFAEAVHRPDADFDHLLHSILLRYPRSPRPWLELAERELLRRHWKVFTESKETGIEAVELDFEAVPFCLNDGQQIELRGRLDRVDRGRRILDYKTGKRQQTDNLQALIYQEAARSLYGSGPVEFTYLYTHPKAEIRQAKPELDGQDLSSRITNILTPLENGIFAQSTDSERDCRFCDYRAACPGHQAENVRRKHSCR